MCSIGFKYFLMRRKTLLVTREKKNIDVNKKIGKISE